MDRKAMIECLPCGICSWDFELRGEGHQGRIGFRWPGESGALTVDGRSYHVEKQGFYSGRWLLRDDGHDLALAEKISLLGRHFHLSGSLGTADLQPVALFERSMTLRNGERECRIAPVHLFTRRATITGDFGDPRLTVFAFWLMALMWRRSASSASGS